MLILSVVGDDMRLIVFLSGFVRQFAMFKIRYKLDREDGELQLMCGNRFGITCLSLGSVKPTTTS